MYEPRLFFVTDTTARLCCEVDPRDDDFYPKLLSALNEANYTERRNWKVLSPDYIRRTDICACPTQEGCWHYDLTL